MRYRLSRLDQIYQDSPLYFLTFCTSERKPLLANSKLHESFQAFAHQATRREIFVGRYLLMPDHIHLFVTLADQDLLSMWVKSLKNTLSKTLRESGIPSPHWQKRYFDHLVRNEVSYDAKWQYVSENPMRKNLATDSKQWAYQGEVESLRFN